MKRKFIPILMMMIIVTVYSGYSVWVALYYSAETWRLLMGIIGFVILFSLSMFFAVKLWKK